MNESNPVPSGDAAAQVWPPPPTNAPPIVAALPAFAPLHGITTATVILLLGGIVVTFLQVVLLSFSSSAAVTSEQWISLLNGLLSLAIIVVFCVWTYRLYHNLRAFGIRGLRWTPGWAVGYFFVPIMGLYRPLQVFQEIWRASDTPTAKEGYEWKRKKAPGYLLAWWLCWIGSQLLAGVNIMASFRFNIPNAGGPWGNWLSNLLATLLAILVVQRITARQEETARALSLLA